MKKLFSVSAVWREKDVEFLNSLNISRKIEKGMCIFSIEEGNDYNRLIAYYSKKDSLFSKTKPIEFKIQQASCIFSKEDLDNAKYYAISSIPPYSTPSTRYPQPKKKREYIPQVFSGDIYKHGVYYFINEKKQIAPFKILKPKWKKNEVCFNLGLETEFTCFKKEFFKEVIAPLGLQSMAVLDFKTRIPLEDTVQLIIPLAKSKLLIENSAYDIHPIEESRGYKEYAVQTLDFFPPFENEFDFHICYSQEYFAGGLKKIIISKDFYKLMVKHNIIKYNADYLIPMKSK